MEWMKWVTMTAMTAMKEPQPNAEGHEPKPQPNEDAASDHERSQTDTKGTRKSPFDICYTESQCRTVLLTGLKIV